MNFNMEASDSRSHINNVQTVIPNIYIKIIIGFKINYKFERECNRTKRLREGIEKDPFTDSYQNAKR